MAQSQSPPDAITAAFAGPTAHLIPHVQAAAENLNRITTADADRGPYGSWLFGEVAAFIVGLRSEAEALKRKRTIEEDAQREGGGHVEGAKRRKVEAEVTIGHSAKQQHDTSIHGTLKGYSIPVGATNGTKGSDARTAQVSGDTVFTMAEVSFAVPVRKKLTLEILVGPRGGVCAFNPGTALPEVGVAWKDIEQIACVPVPEKAQPQYNFVFVPKGSWKLASSVTPAAEAIVFSVSATPAKSYSAISTYYDSAMATADAEDTNETYLRRILNHHLAPLHKSVLVPSTSHFTSSLVQAHRKNESAFHVKAFRGTKDGFLYFLPAGILFGFKKPVLFFPFGVIHSISYTSVLQRTFNLNVAMVKENTSGGGAAGTDEDEIDEIEFSMVDQVDFAGIDAYVKIHGLNDASLAAGRKAKRFNVNPVAKREDNAATRDANNLNGVEENVEEEEGELARAERELQDAEDEEEEDYDPGSEGESEGSGSSDEEDAGGDADDAEEQEAEDSYEE